MHTPHRLAASVAALVAVTACATNPATGERELSFMSEAQEIAIGRENDTQIRQEMGIYDDPDLVAYVDSLGQQLARNSHRPDLEWHFTVVDSPAINAFALPGGYIYMTRGIMAYLDDEAELAGVLGHEIGHVTARHSAQAYTRATGATAGLILGSILVPEVAATADLASTGLGVLFLRFGRDDELQADRLGAEYAAGTGWDPAAVPDFLTTLGRVSGGADRRGVPGWLSTHPQPEDRVTRIQTTVTDLKAASPAQRWRSDRDGYLRRVDGLMFGDNPREGIVRGRAFLHPDLRFALEFPEGWDVSNGAQQVVARIPGQDAYMLLQVVDEPQGRTIRDVARRQMTGANLREQMGQTTTVNGLEAYVGVYQGRLGDLGQVTLRAAHIRRGQSVYLLAGFAGEALYAEIEPAVSGSLQSFRELSPAEAERIRPNRVSLYTARRGDTWESVAEGPGQGIVTPATLAIMNGSPVDSQPVAGMLLKVVVEGEPSA